MSHQAGKVLLCVTLLQEFFTHGEESREFTQIETSDSLHDIKLLRIVLGAWILL